MKEGTKQKSEIEIQYIGKNKLFLHKQIGSGTLGNKNIRLNLINNGTIIFELNEKGKGFESWGITPDSMVKSFIKLIDLKK